MRSLLIALPLGLALATIAYAHTGDGSSQPRQAGALVCHTVTGASLVVGNARLATCTFIDEKRSFGQVYGAHLAPREDGPEAESRMIVLKVTTADSEIRPGALEGSFVRGQSGKVLHGRAVSIALSGDADEPRTRLVATDTFVPLRPIRNASRH